MITPRFTATQDASFVTLTVRVPHVRVGAAEVSVVDGTRVAFWCKPFLLQLQFDGALVDDERLTATYDPDDENGTVAIRLPKAEPGAHFADLDLAARLLAPRTAPPISRLAGAAPDVDLMHLVAQADGDDEDGDYGEGGGVAALARAMDGAAIGAVRARDPSASPLIEVIGISDAAAAGDSTSCNAAVHGAAATGGVGRLEDSGSNSDARERRGTPVPPPAAGVNAAEDPSRATTAPPAIPAPAGGPALAAVFTPAGGAGYGFNRRFTRFFSGAARGLRAEFPALLPALADPDTTPPSERRRLRIADEEGVWAMRGGRARYAADCAEGRDDPLYAEAMAPPPGVAWWTELQLQPDAAPVRISLTEAEGEALASLSRRELLVDGRIVGSVAAPPPPPAEASTLPPSPARAALPCVAALPTAIRTAPAVDCVAAPEASRLILSLIPLLAAYAYDARMTGGEPSVESAWTVVTLSPLLSWADDEVEVDAAGEVEAEERAACGPPIALHRDPLTTGATASARVTGAPLSDRLDAAVAGATAAAVELPHPTAPLPPPHREALLTAVSSRRLSQPANSNADPVLPVSGHLVVVQSTEGAASGAVLDAATAADSSGGVAAAASGRNGGESGALVTAAAAAGAGVAAAGDDAALRAAAAAFVRRALLYPYLRRWDLALRCIADAGELMCRGGARGVLRVLLAVRALLAGHGESHYLLNTLFMDDYCAWVARGGVSDAALVATGVALVQLAGGGGGGCGGAPRPLHRGDPPFAGWNLERLEGAALQGDLLPEEGDDEGECSDGDGAVTSRSGDSESDSDSD